MKMPKYTQAFIDRHGKARFYFRKAGSKQVPLPGLPWSPSFMAAYEAALEGEAPRIEIGASRTKPGTINALVVSYFNSMAFQALARRRNGPAATFWNASVQSMATNDPHC